MNGAAYIKYHQKNNEDAAYCLLQRSFLSKKYIEHIYTCICIHFMLFCDDGKKLF